MPGVQTIQGPLAYCAALAPYPFFEGETQKNSRRVKEDVVHSKGREFSSDLKIDTMDNPTLARILELYQKQLEFFGKRLAGGADQSAQKQKQDVH